MASVRTNEIIYTPISASSLRRRMRKPKWSLSDTLQLHSIKKHITIAKSKGYDGLRWVKVRPLVQEKLKTLGYKMRFNCGYWIIYWSK